MAWRVAWLVLLVVTLGGCKPWDAWGSKEQPPPTGFLRDTARVVSVDPALGQAVLDLHGKQVRAYWETQTALAQGGMIAQPDNTGLRLPVGEYKQPVMKQQVFTANPGDTISFVGLWTGDQIFLRGISVHAH